MSFYGVLRSGVSGMNAQSNKLGIVAENIQNSSATGYKRASTEFASLILPSSEGNYHSGSVTSQVRYTIGDQGPSPDNLYPRAGNVYEATASSGGYQVGFPEMPGFGPIASGALEGSNVDIGTSLTAMIETQTSYTVNPKVFQRGWSCSAF